jgi:hypothetical protein
MTNKSWPDMTPEERRNEIDQLRNKAEQKSKPANPLALICELVGEARIDFLRQTLYNGIS